MFNIYSTKMTNFYNLSFRAKKKLKHRIEQTLFSNLHFVNFFQKINSSPPKRPIFLKELSIFSCRTFRILAKYRVGIFGALKCRNFWSLCVGQIGAPPINVKMVLEKGHFKPLKVQILKNFVK